MRAAGDSAVVQRFVERVARAYGASTVASDAELGAGEEVGSRADLVVSVEAPSRIERWPEHLARLGKLAGKALVVIVSNPERGWPLSDGGLDTTELARVLWEAGRVRERAYLALPSLVAGLRGGHAREGRVSLLVRRTARLLAFVVDTAPRTPQGRRRLARAGAETTGREK
jgi:hypothetical protein